MADADDVVLRFQQLGFDEAAIREALLIHDGDAERAGSWLFEQLDDVEQQALPNAVEPAAPANAVDRRLLAARAVQRDALVKTERREREEARLRAIKEQEQAEIDRKRARARSQAERNQAAAHEAEEAARAGRGTHAEAAEVRAVNPVAAALAPAVRAPVCCQTVPNAAPPAAEAAGTAAACRAAAAETEAGVGTRVEAGGVHSGAMAPAVPPTLDTHAKLERKLRMLLQQEGLAADEAAMVAASCKVLESEPLVLDVSPDGREMRTLLVESARAGTAVPPPPAASTVARAPQGDAVASSAPPPPRAPATPPPAGPEPVPEHAPEAQSLREIQDREYAAALAADQAAEVKAATAKAAAASGGAEALADTAEPAAGEPLPNGPESPVMLSAQELRDRRLAALERGEPRSG